MNLWKNKYKGYREKTIWTELFDIDQQARSSDFIPAYIAQEDSQSKECRKYWPPRKTQHILHVNIILKPPVLVNSWQNTARVRRNHIWRLDFMSFFTYAHNSSFLSHFSNTSNIILNSYWILLLSPHPFRTGKNRQLCSVNKFCYGKHAAFRGYIPPAQSNCCDK